MIDENDLFSARAAVRDAEAEVAREQRRLTLATKSPNAPPSAAPRIRRMLHDACRRLAAAQVDLTRIELAS